MKRNSLCILLVALLSACAAPKAPESVTLTRDASC